MVRGNRGRSRCRSGHRDRSLRGGLGGRDLWNSGGRHLARVFCLDFFLFDKVVTAGKLFYDCARRNCNEYARKKKRNREYDTHTEGNTVTVVLGFFMFI